ncbi:magnesium transporter [Pseudomonas sp. Choline-3u-10]|jgi:magnesium transporter|uniref:magnesium transporter CorA family protein n=1 Tax=Pseudomonadaceae TaxID=135621 RepID=UPI000617DD13|nr:MULTISPECIES: magnesium transporter CorA family protein [Pseudomonadaceae]MAL34611.1 magnesium transporter [Pseudomonas sp.]MBU0947670.1 magnesium transporter CorA family protein [Gammaproteobacteria bacterium]KJJ62925.1 magnesium transporter [Pseudomonas sp. 10B238]MBK3797396.1 magnesium transporter [Stutzerimonas stutzeri]MBK3876236.1 magnesium transporter [Stutzerimonas stutzeri]|tara:strand:+ start:3261 stop:4226 length:966 start_codon:yes stop_codon:yes gene_type:complete
MIIFHCLENGALVRRVAENLQTLPDNMLWADLLSPDSQEERFIESSLGLDIPTREELAEIEDSSRFYDEDGAIFMTTTVVMGIADRRPENAQVTFVLTKRCLVTVRYTELSAFRQFETKSSRQPSTYSSSHQIFLALADAVVDRIADVLESVQVQLQTLSRCIFDVRKEQRTDLQQIIQQLGQHRSLLSQLGESLFSSTRLLAFYRLHANEPRQGAAKGLLKALERDVRSLGEHQARLLGDIAFLLDATLGLINIEQNAIIKVFSIAAVLFLPPTLVGTVYGMNFESMPELSWSFGYPMALGMMVISAIIPYAWFKFRDWL